MLAFERMLEQHLVSYRIVQVTSVSGCHTATGTHMPHGITQCYLPPGRGDIPALNNKSAFSFLRRCKRYIDSYIDPAPHLRRAVSIIQPLHMALDALQTFSSHCCTFWTSVWHTLAPFNSNTLVMVWGPIYKISYDLSYDYRKFIVRST